MQIKIIKMKSLIWICIITICQAINTPTSPTPTTPTPSVEVDDFIFTAGDKISFTNGFFEDSISKFNIGQNFDKVYINQNGVLSFGLPYTYRNQSSSIPISREKYASAVFAYWDKNLEYGEVYVAKNSQENIQKASIIILDDVVKDVYVVSFYRYVCGDNYVNFQVALVYAEYNYIIYRFGNLYNCTSGQI